MKRRVREREAVVYRVLGARPAFDWQSRVLTEASDQQLSVGHNWTRRRGRLVALFLAQQFDKAASERRATRRRRFEPCEVLCVSLQKQGFSDGGGAWHCQMFK